MLELNINHTVELRVSCMLLTQVVRGQVVHHYHSPVDALTLCLWSMPSGAEVSQQEQWSAPAVQGNALPLQLILPTGKRASTGVMDMGWIQRIPFFPW